MKENVISNVFSYLLKQNINNTTFFRYQLYHIAVTAI